MTQYLERKFDEMRTDDYLIVLWAWLWICIYSYKKKFDEVVQWGLESFAFYFCMYIYVCFLFSFSSCFLCLHTDLSVSLLYNNLAQAWCPIFAVFVCMYVFICMFQVCTYIHIGKIA